MYNGFALVREFYNSIERGTFTYKLGWITVY